MVCDAWVCELWIEFIDYWLGALALGECVGIYLWFGVLVLWWIVVWDCASYAVRHYEKLRGNLISLVLFV